MSGSRSIPARREEVGIGATSIRSDGAGGEEEPAAAATTPACSARFMSASGAAHGRNQPVLRSPERTTGRLPDGDRFHEAARNGFQIPASSPSALDRLQ